MCMAQAIQVYTDVLNGLVANINSRLWGIMAILHLLDHLPLVLCHL